MALQLPEGMDALCHTTSKEDTNFKFAWSIEKFGQKMLTFKNGEFLKSGIFNVDVEGVDTKWELCCYPTGLGLTDTPERTVGICIAAKTAATDIKGKKIAFTIEIVDSKGSLVKNSKGIIVKSYEKFKTGIGFVDLVTHEILKTTNENLLPRDSLTFVCSLKFSGSDQVTMKSFSPLDIQLEQADDCVKLELFQTGDLADVEIVCDERSFLCHKSILACKSPVFRAAFTHDMKENSSGKITIEDFDPKTVEDMLLYIYGGKIEGLEDKAEKLLAIANKYDLQQLKKKCEALLTRSLNVKNCLDFLILADLHSASILKPWVIKFIVENSKDVVSQDNWKEKLTCFPEVFIEVFNAIASKDKL